MTYGGVSHVIGQPPHRAWQYALPAVIRSFRAVTSPGRRSRHTLAGSVSLTSFLSSFPRLHFSQYGFGIYSPPVVTPPGTSGRGHDSAECGKSRFHRYGKFIRGVKRQKAGLVPRSPRPIGSFLKSACKRSQLSSRLSWLSSSFRLQADGRSLVFVGNDPVPVGKIDPDHVASHVFAQSIGKPGWPALVISK